MKETESQAYLGDVISSATDIDLNIEARYKKGIGIVNQLTGLLTETSFGQYFFQTVMLLRSMVELIQLGQSCQLQCHDVVEDLTMSSVRLQDQPKSL